MGSSSIDLSLFNIWKSWFSFKKRKKRSRDLENFSYYLEKNLFELYHELNSGNYRHGGYRKFVATDSKRREISVANIKDRVVHRLLYEYLIDVCDKTFIFDVWSCRKNKGLLSAIKRTQKFLSRCKDCFVWRADVKKFFDDIDQERLMGLLFFRITDKKARYLLKEVIGSYRATWDETISFGSKKGIPIGNLTSQIFANIYLNELDRFVKNFIKPRAYLRYGDDFIIISENLAEIKYIKEKIIEFLRKNLLLEINNKNNIIVKTKWGLKFLGVEIFPRGRRLNRRNFQRIKSRMSLKNISSYAGLVKQHSNYKKIDYFNWMALDKFFNE